MGESWESIVLALSVAFIAFTNLVLLVGFLAFFFSLRRLCNHAEHLIHRVEEHKQAAHIEAETVCRAEECCAREDKVEKVAEVLEWALVGYSLFKRLKKRR